MKTLILPLSFFYIPIQLETNLNFEDNCLDGSLK